MWKIALLLIFSFIASSKCRPATSYDSFPLAESAMPYNIRFEDTNRIIDPDTFRRLHLFHKPSKRGGRYDLELTVPQPKRAFSMLARWRPFNTIGKNRSSIREHNNFIAAAKPVSDFDIVTAETRAYSRTLGGPLRWG
ncbi:hypothetical protein QE152_g30874 [Popillia japonica]|uniref:Uncharacterized protein n=1 Tax=Popillia japonica TaxID=7064 RepID=A0AAW1JDG9_POPJA